MSTAKLVAKISEPAFYAKVHFHAFAVAQNVASEDPGTANHAARIAYANRIFIGEESATLLAAHVVAANAVIQGAIIADEEPSDNDILFVLGSIWDARANALASIA